MQSYYPYLLCGLPELKFHTQPENFSYDDIYQSVMELLTPADRKKVVFFLAPSTHEQVIGKYISFSDEEERADFLQQCTWPEYQKHFLSLNLSVVLGKEDDEVFPDADAFTPEVKTAMKHYLDALFYQAATRSSNAFIRRWYQFDGILKNTIVAYAARLQNRSAEGEFVYPLSKAAGREDVQEPELIAWIKENMGQGDFGLKHRLKYAREMFEALENPDVFERESSVDRFRWNMADEMILGKDFHLDVVLAYMLKAGILRRWQDMQLEKGRAYLEEVVSELRHVNLQGSER